MGDPLTDAVDSFGVRAKVHRIAVEEGLDADLADDFLKVTGGIESGNSHYDKRGKVKKSAAGALGFSQLMPGTAKEVGVDPYDEEDNIRGGLRYFSRGGPDPVARRIGYLSGHNSDAVKFYKRTGRIPKGGDPYTGVSFGQYVKLSQSGQSVQTPQDDDDPLTRAVRKVRGEQTDPLSRAVQQTSAPELPEQPEQPEQQVGNRLGTNQRPIRRVRSQPPPQPPGKWGAVAGIRGGRMVERPVSMGELKQADEHYIEEQKLQQQWRDNAPNIFTRAHMPRAVRAVAEPLARGGAGILEAGSGLARLMAESPQVPRHAATQVADYLDDQARQLKETSEEAQRREPFGRGTRLVQNAAQGFVEYAPLMVAGGGIPASLGKVGQIVAGMGLEAAKGAGYTTLQGIGRKDAPRDIAKEAGLAAANFALMGAPTKALPFRTPLGRNVAKIGGVGVGSAGLTGLAGGTADQMAESGLTMAALTALGRERPEPRADGTPTVPSETQNRLRAGELRGAGYEVLSQPGEKPRIRLRADQAVRQPPGTQFVNDVFTDVRAQLKNPPPEQAPRAEVTTQPAVPEQRPPTASQTSDEVGPSQPTSPTSRKQLRGEIARINGQLARPQVQRTPELREFWAAQLRTAEQRLAEVEHSSDTQNRRSYTTKNGRSGSFVKGRAASTIRPELEAQLRALPEEEFLRLKSESKQIPAGEWTPEQRELYEAVHNLGRELYPAPETAPTQTSVEQGVAAASEAPPQSKISARRPKPSLRERVLGRPEPTPEPPSEHPTTMVGKIKYVKLDDKWHMQPSKGGKPVPVSDRMGLHLEEKLAEETAAQPVDNSDEVVNLLTGKRMKRQRNIGKKEGGFINVSEILDAIEELRKRFPMMSEIQLREMVESQRPNLFKAGVSRAEERQLDIQDIIERQGEERRAVKDRQGLARRLEGKGVQSAEKLAKLSRPVDTTKDAKAFAKAGALERADAEDAKVAYEYLRERPGETPVERTVRQIYTMDPTISEGELRGILSGRFSDKEINRSLKKANETVVDLTDRDIDAGPHGVRGETPRQRRDREVHEQFVKASAGFENRHKARGTVEEYRAKLEKLSGEALQREVNQVTSDQIIAKNAYDSATTETARKAAEKVWKDATTLSATALRREAAARQSAGGSETSRWETEGKLSVPKNKKSTVKSFRKDIVGAPKITEGDVPNHLLYRGPDGKVPASNVPISQVEPEALEVGFVRHDPKAGVIYLNDGMADLFRLAMGERRSRSEGAFTMAWGTQTGEQTSKAEAYHDALAELRHTRDQARKIIDLTYQKGDITWADRRAARRGLDRIFEGVVKELTKSKTSSTVPGVGARFAVIKPWSYAGDMSYVNSHETIHLHDPLAYNPFSVRHPSEIGPNFAKHFDTIARRNEWRLLGVEPNNPASLSLETMAYGLTGDIAPWRHSQVIEALADIIEYTEQKYGKASIQEIIQHVTKAGRAIYERVESVRNQRQAGEKLSTGTAGPTQGGPSSAGEGVGENRGGKLREQPEGELVERPDGKISARRPSKISKFLSEEKGEWDYEDLAKRAAKLGNAAKSLLKEFADPDNAPKEIVSDLGDGKKVHQTSMQFDKRLLEITAKQLYGDKRVGELLPRELIQNSVDAVKEVLERNPEERGKIHLDWNADTSTLIVTDNGGGMPPEVMQRQFIDLAGSIKKAMESTGSFGIGKGVGFYHADKVQVESVAEVNGKRVKSTTSFTGKQWVGQEPIEVVEQPTTDPIGTKLGIQLNPNVNTWGMDSAIQEVMDSSVLPDIDITGQMVGFRNKKLTPNSEKPTLVDTIKISPDTHVDIYARGAQTSTTYANFKWLSNGLFQNSDSVSLPGRGKVPENILVDVRSTLRPDTTAYPWELNRNKPKANIVTDVQKAVRKLATAEAEKKALDFSNAIIEAPITISGTGNKVVDTNGNHPQITAELVKSETFAHIDTAITNLFTGIRDNIAKWLSTRGYDSVANYYENAQFRGYEINKERFGVTHEGRDIYLSPFTHIERVAERPLTVPELATDFINDVTATFTHELTHPATPWDFTEGGHGRDFAAEISNNIARMLGRDIYKIIKHSRIEQALGANNHEGYEYLVDTAERIRAERAGRLSSGAAQESRTTTGETGPLDAARDVAGDQRIRKQSAKGAEAGQAQKGRKVNQGGFIDLSELRKGAQKLYERFGARHGTEPEEAVSIIRGKLRAGSSISHQGGRDYEGYSVTLEFGKVPDTTPYSSPYGPSMHEGAAKTRRSLRDIKRVFLDADSFTTREDAVEAWREIRKALDETGRKDIPIEGVRYNDATEKFSYGGEFDVSEVPTFRDSVPEMRERELNEAIDEALDSYAQAIDTNNQKLMSKYEDRLDILNTEWEAREARRKAEAAAPAQPQSFEGELVEGKEGKISARRGAVKGFLADESGQWDYSFLKKLFRGYDPAKRPKDNKPDVEKLRTVVEPVVESLYVNAQKLEAEGKLKPEKVKSFIRDEFMRVIDQRFDNWHRLNKSAALGIAGKRVDKILGEGLPKPAAPPTSPPTPTVAEKPLAERRAEWKRQVDTFVELEKMDNQDITDLAAQRYPEAFRTDPEKALDKLYHDLVLPKAKGKKAETWREEAVNRLNALEKQLDVEAAQPVEMSPAEQAAALRSEKLGVEQPAVAEQPPPPPPREPSPFDEDPFVPKKRSGRPKPPIPPGDVRPNSLYQTLRETGRIAGTESEHTVEHVEQWKAEAEKIFTDLGPQGAEKFYAKAVPSGTRTELGRLIGEHQQREAVRTDDPKLWAKAMKFSNQRTLEALRVGRAIRAYGNNYKFSLAGSLEEVTKLWRNRKGGKETDEVPVELAKHATKQAMRVEKAAKEVARLQRQVDAEAEGGAMPRKPKLVKGGGLRKFISDEQGSLTVNEPRELREARLRKKEAAKTFRAIEKQVGKYWTKESQPALEAARIEFRDATYELAKTFAAVERMQQGYYRRSLNLIRGAMVSAFPTAARNLQTQAARHYTERVTDIFEIALRSALPIERSDMTFGDVWRNNKRLFQHSRVFSEQILKEHPDEFLRMYGAYGGGVDVPLPNPLSHGLNKLFSKAEDAVFIANVFNRAQEFHIRSAEFLAHLEIHTKKQTGLTLEQFVAKHGPEKLPPELIKAAVNKSLDVTFANTPESKFLKDTVNFFNAWPPTASPAAFPRFMFNNAKFLLEYNPITGLGNIALQAAKKGNVARAIAKEMVGVGLFTLAYQIRSNEATRGEKWYELRIPGTKVQFDTRPFGPFSTYLLMAEAARRWRAGERGLTLDEWVEGLGASSAPGGISIATAERLYGYYTKGQWNKVHKLLGRELGDVGRALMTPVRQFKDLAAAFDKQEAIARDTDEYPILGPILESIPAASRKFPAAYKPTSGRPIQQEWPLTKPLGYRKVAEKSYVESELDRLHFTTREIRSYTGFDKLDREISQHMGELLDTKAAELQADPRYQRANDPTRRAILVGLLQKVRKDAMNRAAKDNPDEFLQYRRQQMPRWKRELIESQPAP